MLKESITMVSQHLERTNNRRTPSWGASQSPNLAESSQQSNAGVCLHVHNQGWHEILVFSMIIAFDVLQLLVQALFRTKLYHAQRKSEGHPL